MNIKRLAIIMSCLAFLAPGSYACGFHEGFGGGAYGMNWQPYDPGGEYDSYSDYEDETTDDDTESEVAQKARPVFSSSVLRSSNAAKAKLAERSDDENADDE